MKIILGMLLLALFLSSPAQARDGWEGRPSVCKDARDFDKCEAWVSAVHQRDTGISCCADSDAYLTDDSVTIGGAFFAIISGDYPNPLQSEPDAPVIKRGTHILVPPERVNRARDDGANPTGHGVVFVSPGSAVALCYFSPTLS